MTTNPINYSQVFSSAYNTSTIANDKNKSASNLDEILDFGLSGDDSSEGVELSDEAKAKQEAKKEEQKVKEEIQKKIEEILGKIKELNAKISGMADGEDKSELEAQIGELNSQYDDLLSALKGDTKSDSASESTSDITEAAMNMSPSDDREQYLENYKQAQLSLLGQHAQTDGSSGSVATANPFSSASTSSAASSPITTKASNDNSIQTSAAQDTQTAQTPVTQTISPDVAKGLDAKLGNGFSAKVEQVAANINCNPNDLLAMMYSESGINPHTVGYNGATGLIQFLPSTAKELGTSTSALKNMSAVEQMDYVEKFFKKNKKMFLSSDAKLDAGTMYALCFLPASAKSEVLCTKGGKYSWAYKANSGVDMNKDGSITKTDLANRLNKKYKEMYKQFA